MSSRWCSVDLAAEAEHLDALGAKLQIVIAEAFGLRRRAVRAGDVVPAGRIGNAGPPVQG